MGYFLGSEADGTVKRAEALFARVHRYPGRTMVVRPVKRLMPEVLVDVGELAGLIYRSDKDQPGRPRAYVHFMEEPPRLVCNPEGTQLYIVGGRYRVGRRGIEG